MQLPDNVSVWLKLLLSLTSHDDISIRKNAIAAVKQNLPTILSSKQKIIASCATFLKEVSVFLLFRISVKNSIWKTKWAMYYKFCISVKRIQIWDSFWAELELRLRLEIGMNEI